MFTIKSFKEILFSEKLNDLFNEWSKVSFEMQKLRDTEQSAEQEKEAYRTNEIFLTPKINFEIPSSSKRLFSQKPKVALLREQGINGHYDMAAALLAAPPMWNVLIVSCVPGSPILCAPMMPTAIPSSTIDPVDKSIP